MTAPRASAAGPRALVRGLHRLPHMLVLRSLTPRKLAPSTGEPDPEYTAPDTMASLDRIEVAGYKAIQKMGPARVGRAAPPPPNGWT